MNNSGISNMGGNMEGTPITQLLNNVENIPKRVSNNVNDIKYIVNKLNQEDKLEKEQKKRKYVNKDTETDTDEVIIPEKKKNKKDNKKNTKTKKSKDSDELTESNNFKIPELIKDAGLIWIIYLVLSINLVKNFIANYMTVLNPNEEGVVSFKGVATYGLLLALLFLVIKFSLKHFDKY